MLCKKSVVAFVPPRSQVLCISIYDVSMYRHVNMYIYTYMFMLKGFLVFQQVDVVVQSIRDQMPWSK